MRTRNSHYFNIWRFLYKLSPLFVVCFLIACRQENPSKNVLLTENRAQISAAAININTATAGELEKLPHVGAKTAQSIIEYREKFGAFRKPEHLILVRGISDRKFREIANLVKTE